MSDSLKLPILQGYTGAPAPTSPAAFTITYTTAPASGAAAPAPGGAAICGVATEVAVLPCIGVMGATQMPGGPPNFTLPTPSQVTTGPCGVAGFATFGGVGVYGHGVTGDGIVGETTFGAAAGVTGRNLTPTGAGIHGVGGQFAGKFDGPVQVNGGGATNVDLYVTGRIRSGDANNAGGLWVNSNQTMFVGDAGANKIGFYNGFWGLILDSFGNAGVGTTTPYARLSVGDGGTGGNKLAIFSQDNNGGQIQIGNPTSNGEASIGFSQGATASPHPDGLTGSTTWVAGIGSWGSGNSFVIGNTVLNKPALTITTSGTVSVVGDVVLTGSDCAEDFDIAAIAEFGAGTVMVLDDLGLLQESRHEYDKKVAGVISGAGRFKPGLILGRDERSGDDGHRAPVALVGKVYCKVDAQYAPIEVGDLLTTSPTPGHAMRALDPLKAFGAIIGKALRPLQSGTGLVPILVALQ